MDVSKLYERAQSALERNNAEYAIDLFQPLAFVSDHLLDFPFVIRTSAW